MARTDFILFLPFIDFDWRFIELKFIIYFRSNYTFVFIVAICMYIRGDGRDGLIFVNVNEMLDNLGFG